jgi:hypothetical protein
MSSTRVVYNRSDCPYGCGAPLAPNLRWIRTPCHGCGRRLYPLSATVDDDGRVLWPPARIPAPPEAGLPDVVVWYVVGEEDYDEANAISTAEYTRRRSEAESGCSGCAILVTFVLVVLVGGVLEFVERLVKAVSRR